MQNSGFSIFKFNNQKITDFFTPVRLYRIVNIRLCVQFCCQFRTIVKSKIYLILTKFIK